MVKALIVVSAIERRGSMPVELFKGYVPTKDKKCLMKFKNKSASELQTYDQVKKIGSFVEQGFIPRLKFLDVVDKVYFNEKN